MTQFSLTNNKQSENLFFCLYRFKLIFFSDLKNSFKILYKTEKKNLADSNQNEKKMFDDLEWLPKI